MTDSTRFPASPANPASETGGATSPDGEDRGLTENIYNNEDICRREDGAGEIPAWLSRQNALIGPDACRKLAGAAVLLFGIGGVGGAVAEALARTGVGRIILVDHDVVSDSNINRQFIALHSTVGRPKVEAAAERIRDINPACRVVTLPVFVTPGNVSEIFDAAQPDCAADAIDNVSAKIALILEARRRRIPVVSCMGTGNKLDPSRLRITDISQSQICPLARVMRRELRARGVSRGVEVLWSDEPPVRSASRVPASIAFVPPAAGFLIASAVIRHLLSPDPDSPSAKEHAPGGQPVL